MEFYTQSLWKAVSAKTAGCMVRASPDSDATEGRPRTFDRHCWPTPARFLTSQVGFRTGDLDKAKEAKRAGFSVRASPNC